MRATLARQISDGRWFHRIDTGRSAESDEAFRASVAAQFGVALEDIGVVVRMLSGSAEYDVLAGALAAGALEGRAVITPALAPPSSRELARARLRQRTASGNVSRQEFEDLLTLLELP